PVRGVADRLHFTRLYPGSGPHTDVHVNRFVAHIFRHRRKRLGVDHRINPRFIDLTDARALFNFDQLRASARVQLEPHADRFTARPPADTAYLSRPTAADEEAHLLPIGLPLSRIGERHEILFDQRPRLDRRTAGLGLIDDQIADRGFLGADSRRFARIADRLLML